MRERTSGMHARAGIAWLGGSASALVFGVGCGESNGLAARDLPVPGRDDALASVAAAAEFVDVTQAAGIRFEHQHGGEGRRHLPETMGGGAAWFDLDADGDLDLFLLQSGALPDAQAAREPARNALYRNIGGGRFEDITESSGAARSTGYGQGVAAGDVDGDGFVDLYVCTFGADVLLHNLGDASFRDTTTAAGIDNREWSCSAAFFDMDADGDLDLFVVNYVRFGLDDYRHMTKGADGFLAYPHPDRFRSAPDVLYRNDGGGRFTDVTAAAGIRDVDGKGLGVVAADLDADGHLDLYVANDSTPNHMYRNLGDGTFADATLASNAGYNADGSTEAGMGVAVADVDGDLRLDLFVTNLDVETNTLYRNQGELIFSDETRRRGLAASSVTFVGFGVGFLDFDLDGDADLLVANGHIIDNIRQLDPTGGSQYAQRCLLYENDGAGVFRERAAGLPACLAVPRVVRGAAFADYDDDGDLDVLLVQNNGPAVLIRNDHPRKGGFLSLHVVDDAGRTVLGARCTYRVDGRERLAVSLSSGSYAVANDPRLILSLPGARVEELAIDWPGGHRVTLNDVEPGRFLTVGPKGMVRAR